jgi:hypothetical protein
MPRAGRITLTAMLNEAGRIVGEFTVARPGEVDEFYLFGSLAAEVHHSRWFRHHLPADGGVRFEVLGLDLTGLSITGPLARDVLGAVCDLDLSTEAFRFMDARRVDLGMIPALVARINYSGDLGYELWVAPGTAGPSTGSRGRGRMAPALGFGTDVAPARESTAPGSAVPADLHAAEADHPLSGSTTVHRPGGARAELAAGGGAALVAPWSSPTRRSGRRRRRQPIWHGGSWAGSLGLRHHVNVRPPATCRRLDARRARREGFEIEIIGRGGLLQPEPLRPAGLRMRQ